MFNERAFIAQVEAAEPAEFSRLLQRPTRDEEMALRRHLGDAPFERMHALAARQPVRGGPKRGNVVVIHGIMGGELTAIERGGEQDRIWVNLLRLITGCFERLQLDAAGVGPADPRWDVRASGILKKYYGDQLLYLSQEWNVRAFWYDWRLDLQHAAAALDQQLTAWFGARAPVHLVAHSMGGLVARAFIRWHREHWEAMAGEHGGRLLMLGTPNYGSFAVPQILTGLEGMVRKIAAADLQHDVQQLCAMVATFPGVYQMMPAPFAPLPDLDLLYRSYTYGAERKVPQPHLDAAKQFHLELKDIVEPERMVYVAGYNRPTLLGIDGMRVADPRAYRATRAGDGRVPHVLGLLPGVRTYYVDESHDALPLNAKVLAATTSLLETGQTKALPASMPPITRALTETVDSRNVPGADETEVVRIRECAKELQMLRGLESSAPVSAAERDASELLLRGWLGGALEAAAAPLAPTQAPAPAAEGSRLESSLRKTIRVKDLGSPQAAEPGSAPHHLHIRIARHRIEDARDVDGSVDAIAVGHYVGVNPQNAELALDRAISGRLAGLEPRDVPAEKLVLTQYTQRGTIRGELGQMFVLPDPRADGTVLVIAGMGVPGRFGAPEAAVLARELVWSLARLGKTHLATVLIGSGAGNLEPEEAVDALLRGVAEATAGEVVSGGTGLERLTIVEWDPGKTVELDDILTQACARPRKHPGLEIEYEPLREEVRAELRQVAADAAAEAARQDVMEGRRRRAGGRVPTRLTVAVDRRAGRAVYRLGAITSDAAVPEREVVLDESLVTEANDLLPGLTRMEEQVRQGRFLERLLLSDMREALSSDAPLVLLVDATTARIHWEMVAQPNAGGAAGGPPLADGFLATKRNLTRQLRTTFAPIPEPPPPMHRPLSVLIVADPAGDAPLPGAAREGFEIYDLFQRFRQVYPRASRGVDVKLLTGPVQASRNAVLNELFSRPYDILHYAGHCAFDEADPAASGWIFDGGTRLSAYELSRVDRVPRFVFSNACESGITPDRADRRNAALAPSFAEKFFERGVANFVCTAWPVGDSAALTFAMHLYAALLGIGSEEDPYAATPRSPLAMHAAMLEARLALLPSVAEAEDGPDVPFWGAYQHYGNPDFRVFSADDLRGGESVAGEPAARGRTARGKKPAGTARKGAADAPAGQRPSRRRAGKTAPADRLAASRKKRTAKPRKAPADQAART